MTPGSSPRVRGSRIYSRHQADGDGIIPADAGLTHADPTKWAAYRDHPRGCGAHLCLQRSGLPQQGASPRMRGSPVRRARGRLKIGVIPADAGLTEDHEFLRWRAWGHPRRCGAHPKSKKEKESDPGSSPRMRASLSRGITCMPRSGVIPAGAGLTLTTACLLDQWRDHPRGCGAHSNSISGSDRSLGSSPRVRGSQRAREAAQALPGIIPAGAGLTAWPTAIR